MHAAPSLIPDPLGPAGSRPLRRGWCPGAWRPMESGDGLILRLRPVAGRLRGSDLALIAELARQHGNGRIDLTARANLQLRGLAHADVAPVQDALAEASLLDPDAAAERRRNLLAAPLSGLDRTACIDGHALALDVGRLLATAPGLDDLPAKFLVLLDDGGALPLDAIAADIRLRALRDDQGPSLALGLGGTANESFWLAPLGREEALDALAALMRHWSLHRPDERLTRIAPADRAAWAGALGLAPATAKMSAELGRHRPPPRHLGACRLGGLGLLGAAAPFGRLEAPTLASLAECIGPTAQVRLTPWRSIILPEPGKIDAAALAAGGLVLDPASPLLKVAACAGAAGCRHGTTQTQADAARLALLLPPGAGEGTVLHVSGCAKGCAHPGAAPVTLVGRDGRYDLVRHGPAGGQRLAIGLGVCDAARRLAELTAD